MVLLASVVADVQVAPLCVFCELRAGYAVPAIILFPVTLRPSYQFNSFLALSRAIDCQRCARSSHQGYARSHTKCVQGEYLLICPDWACGKGCATALACLHHAHKGWQPQEQAEKRLMSKMSWNQRLHQCGTCFRCWCVEYTS